MPVFWVVLTFAAVGPYAGKPPLPGALDAPPASDAEAACEAVELLGLAGYRQSSCVDHGAAPPPESRVATLAAVMRGGLEVDGFISDIQAETAALQDLQALAQSARDRRVALLSVAAGIMGIGAAAGTAMTLEPRTTTAGIWVGTVAGVTGGVLSIYAALAAPGAPTPIHVGPSMLGPLLGRPSPRSYPPLVNGYLGRPPAPGGASSRRELLLAAWSKLGLVGPSGMDAGLLTTPLRPGENLDADVVATRSMMLGDLRGIMAGLKRDLGVLADLVAREPGR